MLHLEIFIIYSLHKQWHSLDVLLSNRSSHETFQHSCSSSTEQVIVGREGKATVKFCSEVVAVGIALGYIGWHHCCQHAWVGEVQQMS